MIPPRLQRTLAGVATVEGRGYWTGERSRVEFRPAAPGSGRYFVRDDFPVESRAITPATVAYRLPATRRTVLADAGVKGPVAEVAMVEHVLAALAGLGVDNCEIGVTATEMPGCDGSAAPFIEAIDEVGFIDQAAVATPLVVTKPVRCGDERSWIEARPPMGRGLTIEYRLDYGAATSVGRQWLVVEVDEPTFRYEIAPARTFVLESEAQALVAQGLGSHVTPQDLLIFRDTPGQDSAAGPIDNPLRYPDECVRHKILDVIGDLALAGRPIIGHIVACCSGHRLNGDLVEALLATHPQTAPGSGPQQDHPSVRRSA
ncbi:UDP-3-O-acyl-N-acetylglucosamine deacetylase [Botrimarina hoheduenensis]|uniref:UDP-3-O-acyl-N-acetylglucosamine deacetylase n=1 Tax=Botrimarina hoheduenensis TaxID=2528000 RepID=A0A5C5WFU4_9BACT|nr:UDP-3-O-acyl-N-acetylglucosamine deacetylase [Botrimarina hoheduenensis]TWT48632.1 UDP-3-O-[3-hydroxymyristoyl] N-acetylglucosamine deacetylase [Botrimarina hoheduenensis]